MDVVEGEEVEEMVRGGVFPGFMEGASLRGEDGLGQQDAFLEI